MNKYIILSFNKGFFKVKRPDGTKANLSEKKMTELKKDRNNSFSKQKIEEVKIEEEASKVVEKEGSKATDKLTELKVSDLMEIAKRLGLEPSDDKISKAQLIEYIVKNDK